MNEMIKKQLNHRTIREFKEKEIPEDVYRTLLEVAQRTASSTAMQQSSIIRVTDSKLRKGIADICTQEYAARAPILLIFIVDTYRNHQIALEQGYDLDSSGDMDRFFQGFTDATLAAQNMINAAEAMDLGTVVFGSVLNDPWKLCELLELPKYTFPVLGLGIGYPNQDPELKPRMDMKFRVFDNKYKKMDNYLELLADYDKEMQTYYDLRQADKPLDKFTTQVVGRLTNVMSKRQEIVNAIVDQGFDLKLS
ncbi:MAG TPA: NADPH-dependent oxidoreductase [Tissierellaceae bacterium]|nr:NADPH-dependent oxidoreductase [Tissierellaceae bacterium]